jgi:hypothetical protein
MITSMQRGSTLAGTRLAGSLIAWGANWDGQCDVPSGQDFVAVAGGRDHSLAIRADGSLVAWGDNGDGQCDVPSGNDFVAIAGGGAHSLAIRVDGSLIAWGDNGDGQCDVPSGHNFVAIAAGEAHSLAIRADGSLIAWGNNGDGQCDVPSGSSYVAIAAGEAHSLGLRRMGPSAHGVRIRMAIVMCRRDRTLSQLQLWMAEPGVTGCTAHSLRGGTMAMALTIYPWVESLWQSLPVISMV